MGPRRLPLRRRRGLELAAAGIYTTSQYGGIDSSTPTGPTTTSAADARPTRINIGLPYYTRGLKSVTGGTGDGAGAGTSTDCRRLPGLTKCGDGAVGIDNLWHDLDTNGEVAAGSNPMWHAKNLEKGVVGDVTDAVSPADTELTGTYARKYDSTLVAPWLRGAEKKVFVHPVGPGWAGLRRRPRGIGGTMVWELAGITPGTRARAVVPGSTLTRHDDDTFKNALPIGCRARHDRPAGRGAFDDRRGVRAVPLGDSNYPIPAPS